MIGDFILWVKKSWKQCFCLHDYKTVFTQIYGLLPYDECKKCGRKKSTETEYVWGKSSLIFAVCYLGAVFLGLLLSILMIQG